jgi:hypothetical protein
MKRNIKIQFLITVTIFINGIIFLVPSLHAQGYNSEPTQEWTRLLELQKYPLETSNEEAITVDGIVWQRVLGEKEFILTPKVQNIKSYHSRIFKSGNVNFEFVKVKITKDNKRILEGFGIFTSNYLLGDVNIMLPITDIETLKNEGVTYTQLNYYGKINTILKNSLLSPNSVIYNEDFETEPIPGSIYSSSIDGSANCGWKDVSCYKHSGDWSIWCAGDGAGCNACGDDYVNNMNAEFYKSNSINTSTFQNLSFTWWMDYDFNNTGTNDVLTKYWWLNGSWQLSPISYNSSSAKDGQLWSLHTSSFPGIQNDFSFSFNFASNSIGTSYGVYIDDVQLSGTQINTSINEMNSKDNFLYKVFPNPSNGEININSEKTCRLILTNELGQLITTVNLNSSNNYSSKMHLKPGVYFIEGNGSVKKLVVI